MVGFIVGPPQIGYPTCKLTNCLTNAIQPRPFKKHTRAILHIEGCVKQHEVAPHGAERNLALPLMRVLNIDGPEKVIGVMRRIIGVPRVI